MDKKQFVEMLVKSWNAPFVARSETKQFTGGALSGRTVANAESAGDPVEGRITIGRQIAYPTQQYAEWIARRMLKVGKSKTTDRP